MKRIYETEILLEIALKVGNSLDLNEMLLDCITTMMRLLNCSGAQVIRSVSQNPNRTLQWEPILSIPRPILHNKEIKTFLEGVNLPKQTYQLNDWLKSLPISKKNGTKTRYLFNLQGFGVLLLEKNGDPFESSFILSLQPILNKLSNAALACTAETERKRAEESLHKRERRFEQLIQNSFDAIVILDDQGIQRYVSPSVEQVHGYTPDELTNIAVIEQMIHPDDQQRVLSAFQQVINAEEGGVEYRHKRKAGGWVYLEARAKNQLSNPDINGIVVNVRDITERKLAEEKLLNTQVNMLAIVENSLESIWSINTDMEITYINQVFVNEYHRAFGIQLKPGSNILNGLPEAIRNVWEERYSRVLTGERFVVVDKAEVKDSVIHFEVAMNPIFVEGNVIGASMSGRNITERINSEEILRASEKRAAAQRSSLVNLTVDPVFTEDNITNALQRVTEEVSQALNVSRASVWLLNDDQTELICLSLFNPTTKTHSSGSILKTTEFPNYFLAIQSENRIYAEDAQNDPRTCELCENYLKVLGINSLLDAGIFLGGKLVGVVSAEHIGPKRKWHPDEESFISTVASIAAQLFLNDERRKAEEAVRESRNLLDATQQLAHIGGWEWDIEHQTMYWTDETYRIHGLKPGTPPAGSPEHVEISLACYDSEDRKTLEDAFRLIAEEGIPYDFELPFTRVDGKRIWIRTMANAVKKGSRFVKVLGNIQDITKRKELEETLKKQSSLREVLMEIAGGFINIPVHLVDNAIVDALSKMGGFVNADRAYTFDYDWEKNVCDNTYEWCAQGISPEIGNLQGLPLNMVKNWVNTHSEGKTMYIPNVFDLPKEGAREILEPQGIKSLIAVPMMNEGNCIGFVGFDSVREHHIYSEEEQQLLKIFAQSLANVKLKNSMLKQILASKERAEQGEEALQKMYYELQVSEEETRAANEELSTTSDALKETNQLLHQALEKAQESDRLKTAFLQNMSHEIRTPLNAIQGFSGLLRNTDVSVEIRKDYLSIIQNSCNQLLSIVNDILTISSIDTGQEKINNTNVCINTSISEIVAIFNQQLIGKPLRVKVASQQKDFVFETITDITKLRQIFGNLLTNAIKYTSAGDIELGYAIKDRFIEFFVKDNGIGIEKGKHNLIFQRFVQANDSIRYQYGGTGLGLSICKGFVELLGGKIWVDSELGKGSTFYFTIPYIPVKKDDLSNSESIMLENFPKNLTILVVEDDQNSFILLRELLKEYNPFIIHAKNGKEAVDICKENLAINIVLMDIKMPVMDGIAATKLIREFNPTLPIVAQSAYATEHDTASTKNIFSNYITKPINTTTLKSIVSDYFQ